MRGADLIDPAHLEPSGKVGTVCHRAALQPSRKVTAHTLLCLQRQVFLFDCSLARRASSINESDLFGNHLGPSVLHLVLILPVAGVQPPLYENH